MKYRGFLSRGLLSAIVLLLFFGFTNADDLFDTSSNPQYPVIKPPSLWADPSTRPTSYAEWKAKQPEREQFKAESAVKAKGERLASDFCIFVDAALYPSIQASLDQYLADLVAEGYSPEIFTISGGTAEDFRAFMHAQYIEGMEGALLIGNLPLAWIEVDCDWGLSEYPMDIFFMDYDGEWYDTDQNGLYDSFYDAYDTYGPEITFGRLYASTLTLGGADEVSLLQNYFDKNHRYRTGQYNSNVRGLAYIDDDWEMFADDEADMVRNGFCVTIQESDPYLTTAVNYKNHLMDGYQFVYLEAHATATTHYFYHGFPSQYSVVTSGDIHTIDAQVMFLMMYACSAARFIENDYLAGWYVFNDSYGLMARGMVATGGAGGREDTVFTRFADGATIGEAFKEHYSWMLDNELGVNLMMCQSFIYTFLGDPTLTQAPRWPVEIDTVSFNSSLVYSSYYKQITAHGGSKPYRWEIIDGAIPNGLQWNDSSAIMMGILNQTGDYYFTVAVTDSCLEDQFGDTMQYYIGVMDQCGDVDGNGLVNILDILYLIDYKFKEGPPPVVYAAGDANSDHTVNILDIIHMINYKFKGGPAPYCFY